RNSKRSDAIETAWVVRCLRVRETELARGNFDRCAEHRPTSRIRGQIGRGQDVESCALPAGEIELNDAIRMANRIDQRLAGAELLLRGEWRTGKAGVHRLHAPVIMTGRQV